MGRRSVRSGGGGRGGIGRDGRWRGWEGRSIGRSSGRASGGVGTSGGRVGTEHERDAAWDLGTIHFSWAVAFAVDTSNFKGNIIYRLGFKGEAARSTSGGASQLLVQIY
jgi:hypothetical protein